MLLTKLQAATAVLVGLAVALLGTGAGGFALRGSSAKPPQEARKGVGQQRYAEVVGTIQAVDAARNTLTLRPDKTSPEAKTFTLAPDVLVLLDDGTGDRLGFDQGTRDDLDEGAGVTLRLSEGRKVTRVWVEGPTVQGILKAADAANNTLTATVALAKTEPAADKTFAVAPTARVFVDDGQPVDKTRPAKQPTLGDLPADAVVTLKLSADRKTVGNIRAEGKTVTGHAKAVDGTKNAITVTIAVKGEPEVDRAFTVAADARVVIDDGKPVDKSKPVRVADVPAGARVTLRLSLDGRSVVALRAEGAHVHGPVKGVDAAANTLTLHDKEEGEKTYAVRKDAAVFLDGKGDPRTLADVPVGAVVDLRLSATEKAVIEVRATGPTVFGTVVGTADDNGITLRSKEGGASFGMTKDTVILADERRAKAGELIEGTVAAVRLSADQSTALEVRAEGPSFQGTVKAFDREKNVLTLTVGAKNGEGGEDKEFKLTKATAIQTEINRVPLKTTDLRVEREVILRLAIDQKSADRITVLGE